MAPPPAEFDYYAELELARDASGQEISAAFRRLARVHHPDKNPNNQEAATAKFQRLQQAYETLSNPAGRRKYDAGPSAASRPAPTHHHHHYYYDDDDDEFDDDYYDDCYDSDDEFYFRGPFSSGPFGGGYFSTGGFPFGPGYSFGGGRRPDYEEMDRAFREAERREEERRQAMFEERRKREEAQAARKKERQDAKQQAADRLAEIRDTQRDRECVDQEERWKKHGAVSKDQRLETCLHSEFCSKAQMKKKFKCSACKQSRGKTAFECPYCSSYLCQLCVTKFAEKRARGWEPVKKEAAPTEDSQPDPEDENDDAPADNHDNDMPGENGDGSAAQAKKSKKKKKKKSKTAAIPTPEEAQDNSDTKTPEPASDDVPQSTVKQEVGAEPLLDPEAVYGPQSSEKPAPHDGNNGFQEEPLYNGKPTVSPFPENPVPPASTKAQFDETAPKPANEEIDEDLHNLSLTRAFIRHATLARGVTEPLLRQAMERFGAVLAVKIDRRKGIAHVDFEDPISVRFATAASPVQVSPQKNGTVQVLEWRDRPFAAPKGSRQPTDKACYKCGKTGHIARFCGLPS